MKFLFRHQGRRERKISRNITSAYSALIVTSAPSPFEYLLKIFSLKFFFFFNSNFVLKDYINHLGSSRHNESLEKLSTQHKLSLSKLRARQRKEQSQMEVQNSRSSHNARKNFCAICKLYHSESRPNHETTELHKV